MLHSTHDSKEFLYTPSDAVENVFILKEGEVTLYKSIEGKKIILDVLKPGAVFGNIGFDPESGESHYAEITQKAYIYVAEGLLPTDTPKKARYSPSGSESTEQACLTVRDANTNAECLASPRSHPCDHTSA